MNTNIKYTCVLSELLPLGVNVSSCIHTKLYSGCVFIFLRYQLSSYCASLVPKDRHGAHGSRFSNMLELSSSLDAFQVAVFHIAPTANSEFVKLLKYFSCCSLFMSLWPTPLLYAMPDDNKWFYTMFLSKL